MSILLDSLEKNKDEENNAVPDVHASHFDDEMLSDEWLLTRVKRWQYIALCLALALITSWFYFYFNTSKLSLEQQGKNVGLNQSISSQPSVVESKPEQNKTNSKVESAKANLEFASGSQQTEVGLAKSQSASSGATDKAIDTSTLDESQNANQIENNKVVYQPKKRELKQNTQAAKTSITTQAKTKNVKNTQVKSAVTQNSPAIFFDELPLNLQESFPSIELGSYVVSDSSENSFVIIDGGFYKINQVIAPDMVLRGINTDHILVEFKSYYVKLPHKS